MRNKVDLFKDVPPDSVITRLKLDNGIVCIFDERDSFNTASIAFFLKRGSRDEKEDEIGFTHFCEHMIFKGTSKYTKENISFFSDMMGGTLNAYTTKEALVIFTFVPYFYVEKSIELILNLIQDSLFLDNEIELEKGVILSEIKGDNESPEEKLTDDFIKNFYEGHSLANSILGTSDKIKKIKRDEIFEFYKKCFDPNLLTVIVSGGKININNIKEMLVSYKFDNRNKSEINHKIAVQTDKKFTFTCMHSDLIHVAFGTSKFKYNIAEDYFKFSVFNLLFGESTSSILYQNIRDRLGLCYSIFSFLDNYRYENIFGVYFSVNREHLDKMIASLSELINNIKQNGITEEKLELAKEQKIIDFTMGADILQVRGSRLAFMDDKLGKIYNFNELVKKIKEISVDDIREIIENIFVKDNFFTTVLYKKKIKVKEWEF